MKEYDLIVIGTGGGNKAASSAMKLGKKVAVIEKGKAGGTCLNRGCIPSKMLIYPANLQKKVQESANINLRAAAEEVDFQNLIQRINQHTDGISERIDQAHTKREGLDYYKGKAKFVSAKVVEVNGEQLTADQILIATGSRPMIPDIPGLAHTPFMTSNEALRAKQQPKSMIVLGGGYIATELGGAYQALGTDVTFIVRSELLRTIDSEIKDLFQEEFSRGKTIYGQTEITKVTYQNREFTVEFNSPDGVKTVTAEELLVCTGITPNADQLGLENTAIKTNSRGYIEVNEFLETAEAGVFAIGDVVGNFLFRHSVNFEAEYFIEANYMQEERQPVNYPPMPAAVFTDPEIASVGLTEAEAQTERHEVIVGRAKYTSTAMAKARGINFGLVKLVFDQKTHQLIGAQIIGEESSIMIQELVQACTLGLTAEQIYRQVYIHPAFPEVVRNALRAALKEMDDKYQILF